MAVIGEPLVTQVKRSASFAVERKAKKRINRFTSCSSPRSVETGFNEEWSRKMKYLSTYGNKQLSEIVSVSLLDNGNSVQYPSRCDTAKAFRKNVHVKSHKEVFVKLEKETPSSIDTYPLLHQRHFMDAISDEAICVRSHDSDSKTEILSSPVCKITNGLLERSPIGASSGVSETSDHDVVTYQGRVVSRKYINGLPTLFFPSVHSALKFEFVKSLDSGASSEVSVVRPLRKAFDQLFDVLHENLQTNDHYASYFVTVVNRWTSVRTELTGHLTRSLLRKLRRSTTLRSSLACYGVLMRALQTFPLTNGVPFSFADLEKAIDELSGRLEFNSRCNSEMTVLNTVLRLIFMVSCLENELLNCKLLSKRRLSLSRVCTWLSAESKFTFVKRIVQVLTDLFKYRASFVNDFVLEKEVQSGEENVGRCVMPMVSELPPLLQRLIAMSQAVSTYPAQTADRIATELAAEYSQITLLSHRLEFLESLSVPLIKLKLCQRILERQYPSIVRARVCGSLTSLTLNYLLNTYMRKTGMKSESGCQLDSDWVPCCVDGKLLPLERDVCEEFSVLLFTIVLSYVQVKKEDYIDCSLWDQATKKNESSLSPGDITTLKNLPGHVEKLRHHLERAVGKDMSLTQRTLVFLQKLACLVDIC